MLKIGEFARLSQVSLKTLRHYDTLGLLRPSQIDPENGYRLYNLDQLADMMRIMALKDCGFALEEIAHLLRTQDGNALEALLHQRVVAQQERVREEQARLGRLLARVQQLDTMQTAGLLYDVAIKQTEPFTLLGRRAQVASTEAIGDFSRSVLQQAEQHALIPVGPLVHLYFDETELDEGLDLFVGFPVATLPAQLPTQFSHLRLAGGEQVACVLYRGEYARINEAYVALDRWLASSGYRQVGPCREIYHRSPLQTADAAAYLTEIQYPIRETIVQK